MNPLGSLSLSLPSSAQSGVGGSSLGNGATFGSSSTEILSEGSLGAAGMIGLVLVALIGVVLLFR